MKKCIIGAVIALLLAPALFSQAKPPQPKIPPKPKATTQPQVAPLPKAAAQTQTPKAQATVKEFTGKVEVKASGAGWRPAETGMTLDNGAWISTGFNATALLDLGTSTLKVKPLTRLQLVELIAREESVSTTLALKVGRVNASVKAAQGVRQEFKVKGPKATAAVRGTEFEFDGLTVKVINGWVFFSNTRGQGRQVGAGEGSSLRAGGLPTTGDQENKDASTVIPYTSAGAQILAESGGKSKEDVTVTIRWQ